MTIRTRVTLVLTAVSILLAATPAAAQTGPKLKDVLKDESAPAEAAAPASPPPAPALPIGPIDDLDRGVPRSSIEGFLAAATTKDWERAAGYLDLRNLPRGIDASDGPELAHDLKVVFDRALWIDLATLSTSAEGHADDGLPSYRDRVGVIDTMQGKVEVLLQRVPREDGVRIWKFSNRTVKDIPLLYEQHGYGEIAESLRGFVPEIRVLGLESWQWVGIIMVLLTSYWVAWVVTALPAWLLRRRKSDRSERTSRVVSGPLRFLVFVLVFREVVDVVAPTLVFRAILSAGLLFEIAVAWTVIRVADLFFDHMRERLERERTGSSVLVRPLRTVTRVVVVMLAVLVWLDNVGFEIGTLLAGLGIGGVAVALAAQKSLEDVFGAVTLYLGRAVGTGDFCRSGDVLGTVEEIGLRWTRVRTLGNTLVNVPNSEFAKQPLENFSLREKCWYHPQIRLRYETTPDQLRYVLVEVRKLLYGHPKLMADPARIRFVGFGEYSFDLDIFAYVDTRVWSEYLEIAEDLNLRIMDIVAQAGTGFALPSETTYLESGPGIDGERARSAEAKVGEWRERKELYLPRFPDSAVAELRGSLPYPPEGAPS